MENNETINGYGLLVLVMDFVKKQTPYSQIEFKDVDGQIVINLTRKTSAEMYKLFVLPDPEPPKPTELMGFQAPFIDLTGWSESKYGKKEND